MQSKLAPFNRTALAVTLRDPFIWRQPKKKDEWIKEKKGWGMNDGASRRVWRRRRRVKRRQECWQGKVKGGRKACAFIPDTYCKTPHTPSTGLQAAYTGICPPQWRERSGNDINRAGIFFFLSSSHTDTRGLWIMLVATWAAATDFWAQRGYLVSPEHTLRLTSVIMTHNSKKNVFNGCLKSTSLMQYI